MPNGVAILADDLSGALDAAAPFAQPSLPIDVIWDGALCPSPDGFALDSETREMPEHLAEARVVDLLPRFAGRSLCLKKVDSLLRGNTIAEIAACWQSGLFRSLVVAPAFPAQGRVTRQARQYARSGSGWQVVGPDLVPAFRDRGIEARVVDQATEVAGSGVLICDAEEDRNLSTVAASADRLEPPVLWCGSSGLAHALAPAAPLSVMPTGDRRLFVIGSRDPASLAQAEALRRHAPQAVVSVTSPGDVQGSARAAMQRLNRHGLAVLWFRLPSLPAEEASSLFRDAFTRLAGEEAPDLLVITGGETLIRLCKVLEATRLRATGEWQPGFPTSVMADGAWRGVNVVSKSGAFGGKEALVELMRLPEGLPN